MGYLTLIIFLVCWPLSVFAQDFTSFMRPGPTPYSFQFDEKIYGDSKIGKNNDPKLSMREWRMRAAAPVWNNDKYEVTTQFQHDELLLSHPDSRLNNYYNIQGGLGFRQKTGDHPWGMNASFGSASDKPFAHERNNFVSMTANYQYSEKWWFILNYANNRPFLNNIPLPGFVYAQTMTKEENLLLGFPFVFYRKQFKKGIDINALALPFSYRMEVAYGPSVAWKVFALFENTPQSFFRDNRDQRSERFFFIEKRLMLGMHGMIIPGKISWRIGGGHAFDRQFFEAKNFNTSKKFLLNASNTWLVDANLRFAF